jgi:hypothetical protein
MKTTYLLAGVVLIPTGFVLFYGAMQNSEWLFRMRRSRLWVRLLGRNGARWMFGLFGGAAMFVGVLLAIFGLLGVDPSVAMGTQVSRTFFDGGIEYSTGYRVYLSPPPPNYTTQIEGNRVYTYQQMFAPRSGQNAASFGILAAPGQVNYDISNDIRELISREPDFASGWVLISEGGSEVRVSYEFIEVNGPLDWSVIRVSPGVPLFVPTAQP